MLITKLHSILLKLSSNQLLFFKITSIQGNHKYEVSSGMSIKIRSDNR